MSDHIMIKPSLHELAARHLTLADGEIAIVEERRYVPKAEWDMGGGLFNNYGEEYPTRRVLAAFPRTEDGRRAALAGLADMERDVVRRRAEIDATLEEVAHTADAERRERIERAKAAKRCATCVSFKRVSERMFDHTGAPVGSVGACARFYKSGKPTGETVASLEPCCGFDCHLLAEVAPGHTGCPYHQVDEREIN